jgi:cell wall assembly regulator SMI1
VDSTNTIEGVWRRIEIWMHLHAPQLLQQLVQGAAEEEIKHLENILGITLPEDVRTSYRRHNEGYEIQLVTTMKILPVESIIYHWQILRELLDDEDWATMPPYYFTDEIVLRSGWQPGPIEPVWYHPRWIPFGTDSAGNLCCLDLAPAPGGAVG